MGLSPAAFASSRRCRRRSLELPTCSDMQANKEALYGVPGDQAAANRFMRPSLPAAVRPTSRQSSSGPPMQPKPKARADDHVGLFGGHVPFWDLSQSAVADPSSSATCFSGRNHRRFAPAADAREWRLRGVCNAQPSDCRRAVRASCPEEFRRTKNVAIWRRPTLVARACRWVSVAGDNDQRFARRIRAQGHVRAGGRRTRDSAGRGRRRPCRNTLVGEWLRRRPVRNPAI